MVHGLAYEGMLTLSSFCLISIIASKLYHKTLNRMFYVNVEKIIIYVDTASVACTFGGVIFLLISVFSSTFSFTAKTPKDSVLFNNQIMLAISAMILWIVFLAIRIQYGKELWNNSFNASIYSFVGFAGFSLLMLAGSIRGLLQKQGSLLDLLYEALNINPAQLWTIETLGIYTLIATSILGIILFLMIRWKSKSIN